MHDKKAKHFFFFYNIKTFIVVMKSENMSKRNLPTVKKNHSM